MEPAASGHFGAVARRQLFAHLAWLCSYATAFDVERSGQAEAVATLQAQYTSSYTRRKMKSDSEAARRTADAHSSRLGETALHLRRTANVLFVPFSQAMKAIFFVSSRVKRPVWEAELKARRVVKRGYALQVLEEMRHCRPQPAYELADPSLIASIAFDQTYLKAAASTGLTAYSAVQTVDAQGHAVHRERATYINGQQFPVPLAAVPLSAADIALIKRAGPYTQDFARVLPLLSLSALTASWMASCRGRLGCCTGRCQARRGTLCVRCSAGRMRIQAARPT